MTWTMSPCSDYANAIKVFTKKWPHEMRAVANNLRTLMQSLDRGANPEQVKSLGFVHGNYALGILSIDETGHEKGSKPKSIRLYIFPCETEKSVYVMLLGDKSSQHNDVKLCKDFVSKKLSTITPKPK